MAYLEKILALTAGPVREADPYTEQTALVLAARDELRLASDDNDDPDHDGDDDSSKEGDTDNDAGHTSHALFKKMVKRGMPDKAAAAMCAKADKKVKASALALDCLEVALSVTQAERDKAHDANNSLPDKSYPINNVPQLKAAAALAASRHGDWQAAQRLVRRRARELGVELTSLPGFGAS